MKNGPIRHHAESLRGPHVLTKACRLNLTPRPYYPLTFWKIFDVQNSFDQIPTINPTPQLTDHEIPDDVLVLSCTQNTIRTSNLKPCRESWRRKCFSKSTWNKKGLEQYSIQLYSCSNYNHKVLRVFLSGQKSPRLYIGWLPKILLSQGALGETGTCEMYPGNKKRGKNLRGTREHRETGIW